MTIVRFALTLGRQAFIPGLLTNAQTKRLFLNMGSFLRQEFVELVASSGSSSGAGRGSAEALSQILQDEEVYQQVNEAQLHEDILVQIYNLIRDNEADHLRELL
jgi:hypothetical protein